MSEEPAAPRRKDAVATRDRLVRAALELFAAQGFRATTTLEIAGRASIAEATIYRHFTGKEALFNEAYRMALVWGIGLFPPVDGSKAPTAKDHLGKMGKQIAEHAQKEPALVAVLLRRVDGLSLDEPSQHLGREFRLGLTQLVATGKQDGTIRPGSAELWASVWLALVGFVVERIVAKEWTAEHPSVTASLAAAWDAIAYRAASPG